MTGSWSEISDFRVPHEFRTRIVPSQREPTIMHRCRLRYYAIVVGLCCLSGFQSATEPATATVKAEASQRELPQLTSFLELFGRPRTRAIVTGDVTWTGATGRLTGYLTRPAGRRKWPALLLIPAAEGRRAWFQLSARELATIGYVVLLIDGDQKPLPPIGGGGRDTPSRQMAHELALADLSAGVRWLRRRDDVVPHRIGVLGWSAGGAWAWALAAHTGLRAAVNCNGPIVDDPALLGGLRHTGIMGVWGDVTGGQTTAGSRRLFSTQLKSHHIEHEFRLYEDAKAGFMDPADKSTYRYEAAEDAWYFIYEFIEGQLEDEVADLLPDLPAGGAGARKESHRSIATIAELMRAVNRGNGLRGALVESLADRPQTDNQWKLVAARAAVLAETGNLLRNLRPKRGAEADWIKQTLMFRTAAESLRTAAKKQDYQAAGVALQQIAASCRNCHKKHR
jgi:carboxymethylenebutenolidase